MNPNGKSSKSELKALRLAAGLLPTCSQVGGCIPPDSSQPPWGLVNTWLGHLPTASSHLWAIGYFSSLFFCVTVCPHGSQGGMLGTREPAIDLKTPGLVRGCSNQRGKPLGKETNPAIVCSATLPGTQIGNVCVYACCACVSAC